MATAEHLVHSWMASERRTLRLTRLGWLTLLDTISALDEFLTSEEDRLQMKGVEFLSSVLGQCPHERLNHQAICMLTTFCCSKLEDIETIIPALKGLSYLLAEVKDIINAIFANVKMRALINLAVGEKDPQNLMLAFAIARVMLDFFNITFCYFPITFRPPPDDPYGISVDDLKQSLRPLGIPVFLEKLTAGSPSTKVTFLRHSTQYMSICLLVYGPPVSCEFGKKVWSSLKLEVRSQYFRLTDPDTEQSALDTVQVLFRTIHADNFQDAVGEDCIMGLAQDIEPEKAQGRAVMKVICGFAGADGDTTHASIPRSSNPSSYPLTASKDILLGLLIISLKAPVTCLPALHGLTTLVHTPKLVADDELGYIVLKVSKLLSKEPDEAHGFSMDTLALLTVITGITPHHLSSQSLPILFPPSQITLCVQPQLFEMLMVRLITKLDLLCAISPTWTIEQESTAAYAHAILTALTNTLDAKVSLNDADVPNSEVMAVAADPRLLQVGVRIIRLVSQTFNVVWQEKLIAAVFAAYTQGLLNLAAPFAPLHLNASPQQWNGFTLFSSTIVPLCKELMPLLLRRLDLTDPSIHLHIINTLSNNIDITSTDKDTVS
ncbi:Dos2-interacting transcription regulator of RNA-Pol-II-domain-containing protein, partial [Suillus paluster]|uniref:Dos2-interacting transcription regulator of RNA-Pol-II-domain-containing protein n=1 Tax=Suillus paluster TaxID=48578 RepID=UPI001B860729